LLEFKKNLGLYKKQLDDFKYFQEQDNTNIHLHEARISKVEDTIEKVPSIYAKKDFVKK
jgi:Asp-tRNA(Asn)/Glu-tRNA(Gln) amidotransferase B subunit